MENIRTPGSWVAEWNRNIAWTSRCKTDQPYLIAELAADIQDNVVAHMVAVARDAGLLSFADRLQREHSEFQAQHGFSAAQRNKSSQAPPSK